MWWLDRPRHQSQHRGAANATALLPPHRGREKEAKQVIGTNTVACSISGVFGAYIGLIEGIVAALKASSAR